MNCIPNFFATREYTYFDQDGQQQVKRLNGFQQFVRTCGGYTYTHLTHIVQRGYELSLNGRFEQEHAKVRAFLTLIPKADAKYCQPAESYEKLAYRFWSCPLPEGFIEEVSVKYEVNPTTSTINRIKLYVGEVWSSPPLSVVTTYYLTKTATGISVEPSKVNRYPRLAVSARTEEPAEPQNEFEQRRATFIHSLFAKIRHSLPEGRDYDLSQSVVTLQMGRSLRAQNNELCSFGWSAQERREDIEYRLGKVQAAEHLGVFANQDNISLAFALRNHSRA
jgi:hypothetical protein